jgi:hypothetical protein
MKAGREISKSKGLCDTQENIKKKRGNTAASGRPEEGK